MRLGVLADIHGNLPALETALDRLRKEGVDGLVCLGDLVGYGPYPNEVVARVAELDIPCVLGNHDQVVATGEGFDRVNDLARLTLAWTQEVVSSEARDYLGALPLRRDLDDGVVLAHGSPSDPWTYIRRPPDAWAELDSLGPGRSLLLLGHTHRQFVVPADRPARATSSGIVARPRRRIRLESETPTAINPGAVGQSRELRPLARFALLDLAASTIDLFVGAYPHGETRSALDAAGLPSEACHARPTLKKAIRQAARDIKDRRPR